MSVTVDQLIAGLRSDHPEVAKAARELLEIILEEHEARWRALGDTFAEQLAAGFRASSGTEWVPAGTAVYPDDGQPHDVIVDEKP